MSRLVVLRMMHSRVFLLLITSRALSRKHRRGSGSEGFSLAAVLIVMLIVLSGSLALAIRGGSGSLASAYQSQTREARAAAESGATQIIAELNKLPNRRMLVSGRPLTGATNSWQNPRTESGGVDPQQQNPCTTLQPTTNARNFSDGVYREVIAGDASKEYRLLSVTYRNSDRSRWRRFGSPSGPANSQSSPQPFNNTNDTEVNLAVVDTGLGFSRPDIAFIELSVEGRILRNGVQVASTTIAKEYEVVPKCCDRSFMGPSYDPESGPLDRTGVNGGDGFDCAYALPGHLSLMVFSRSQDGALSGGVQSSTGTINLEGIRFSQVSPNSFTYSPMSSITCFVINSAGVDQQCNGESNAGGVEVVPSSIAIRNPRYPNWATQFTPIPAVAPAINRIQIADNSIYLQLNLAGDEIVSCDIDNSTSQCLNDPEPFADPITGTPYCGRLVFGTADFHCRLSSIRMNNGNRFIVSTEGRNSNRGRIAFYFEPPVSGLIEISSLDGLQHVKCPYVGIGESPCTTLPENNEFNHLSFVGSGNGNQFSLAGNSEDLHAFVFLRNGEVRLNGNTSFVGSLWSRNLFLSGGNINIKGAMPFGSGVSGTSGQLVFDWVARSVTRTQYYGN